MLLQLQRWVLRMPGQATFLDVIIIHGLPGELYLVNTTYSTMAFRTSSQYS
jgi:hypothetical protein